MRCGIVVNVTGPPPTIDRRYHDAVIVGLDNVVDKATRVHAAAWTKFLDDYLTRRPQRTGEDHCPLTHDDYRRFLAGKPDGVADFLAARGIRLPPGSPTDLTDDTVYGLQNLERQTFLQLLNTGVPEGKSIASFARRLQVAGVRVAAHTSHRNYGHTLDATGLAEVFAVFVDGAVTAELGLPAEPNPAGLIETAKRLGANPGRCVVIDSCQTGLRAGRNGGFALVIAVDAHGDAENLLSSGADAVVADLAAVTVGSGDAAISTIPDALQVYSQLKRLLTGRRPAVFLDFDGTLSDIVERPEAATLVDGAAEALRALAAQCPVAVISGRDLADVRNRVKVDGLWLAGSHGFELVAPDGSHHQNAAATAAIDGLAEAAAQLADALREIAGAVVEHKRFAVAVHYRNVADDSVDNLIAAVRRLGHAAGLRVTTGRKVVELRPDIAWDKGKALDWIGERLGPAEVGPDLRLPIYIGDDLTDEDAFDAVRFTGVGIVVRHNEHGDRRSAATFRLECPYTASDELIGLLARLGYRFAPTQIPGTVDYYLARTSDGSTLSAVVHAWVLARANRSNAMEYFRQVLRSDIADVQGGTTQEGIHLAAMAGSIDLLQRCYSGLELRDDRLVLSPQWPEALGPLEFPFVYRRHQLSLRISGRSATLTAESGDAEPIEVECRGHVQRLRCGHTIEVGCSR